MEIHEDVLDDLRRYNAVSREADDIAFAVSIIFSLISPDDIVTFGVSEEVMNFAVGKFSIEI